jgi:hypothetical protein
MAANEEQRRRMMAMLLRIPPKNALQRQPAPPTSNWLSKPLPMEGRFNMLPIREQVPGMGPSLFNKRELALPGLLAGAVNAATAPGRSAQGLLADPKEEAVNFAGTFMGGGLLGSRMAPAPRGSVGMNAYHGSPHKFDKFDSSKFGTGEGNQAYGHGLYFSESPTVAGAYRTRNKIADGSGSLYHVDIPDEAVGKMLEWDKPLREQPPYVQKILREKLDYDPSKYTDDVGEDVYRFLQGGNQGTIVSGDSQAASEALRAAGIPGIRYGADKTRNIVLFDDKLAKITKRE